MMWVHLWNILNIILTCAIHLIPHNSWQSLFAQQRSQNVSTTCPMGTFETYLKCRLFFGCDQDVPQNEPM